VENWNELFEHAGRKGFKTFATSSHHGDSLYKCQFPEKTILFMGAEGSGLSEKMLKRIDHNLTIPGTGEVESLNVSNATAIILMEWFRQGLK
jgi:TrmH RNA methyltransferase